MINNNEATRNALLYKSSRTKCRFARAILQRFPDLTVREALARVPVWVEPLLGDTVEAGCKIRVVTPEDEVKTSTSDLRRPGYDVQANGGYGLDVLTGNTSFYEVESESWADDQAEPGRDNNFRDNITMRLQRWSLVARYPMYSVPCKPGYDRNSRELWMCIP